MKLLFSLLFFLNSCCTVFAGTPNLLSNQGERQLSKACLSDTGGIGNASKTALITNYTFTGNGLWDTASNWVNKQVPSTRIPGGVTVKISPVTGGSAICNRAISIEAGGNLIIDPGKNFIINGQVNNAAPPVTAGDMDNYILDLQGSYTNTNEDFGGPYGPYDTWVKNMSFTPGLKTAKMWVENIWDSNWKDIQFILDWNNPGAPITTVLQNNDVAGGSTISTSYAAYRVSVRPHPTAPAGTFDFVTKTITLKMQVGYWDTATNTAVGYYGTVYTVVMKP